MPDEPGRIVLGLLTIRSEQQDAHFVSLHGELDGQNAKAWRTSSSALRPRASRASCST
jgi:anti-anti-sigma regulatory factor